MPRKPLAKLAKTLTLVLAIAYGGLSPLAAHAKTEYFADFAGWEQHKFTSESVLKFSGSAIEGEPFRVEWYGRGPVESGVKCNVYLWLMDSKTIVGGLVQLSGDGDIVLEPMISGSKFTSVTFGTELICGSYKYKTRFLKVEFEPAAEPPPVITKSLKVTEFTAKQKLLTTKQKNSVWIFINSNSQLKNLKCTPVSTGVKKTSMESAIATSRAVSACNYAKTLKQGIVTSIGAVKTVTSGKVSRSVDLAYSN